MGVMTCSRKRCDNIMCDTYVDGIGYVCYDCQKEFKEYLKKENIETINEGDIRRALMPFMETEKDIYKDNQISVGDFFRGYTK